VNSIEEILFRLRFHEGHLGVPDLQERGEIERLRPLVRSDETVRYTLITAILEAEYLRLEHSLCLNMLLEEFPELPQPQFLLRMHAYEYRGEDAIGTLSARRLMCERGFADERLKREVEQTVFGRCEPVGQDLYHDFVMNKFWEWAHKSPKYLPWILGNVTLNYTPASAAVEVLLKHSEFPLNDYDLGIHSHEIQCRLAAADKGLSPANLIRALKEDGVPLRAIYEVRNHAPVHLWSEQDFQYISQIASNPQDSFYSYARLLIIRTYDSSSQARDWVQRQMVETPDDLLIHHNLANHTQDPELAQKSLQALADKHDKNGEFVTVINVIDRFARNGRPFPEEWAACMLVRAYEQLPLEWKNQAIAVLKSCYPDHKETLRLSKEQTPVPGYSALPKEFEVLLQLAATSNDHAGRHALAQLVKHFLDRQEVQALLIQKASLLQIAFDSENALKALAFNLPDAPETIDLLTRNSSDPWFSDLQRKLINHRLLRPDTFDQLKARQGKGPPWPRNLAAPSLALWYGDKPETFDIIADELPTLVQRWPDDPRTFAVLRQVLINGDGASLEISVHRTIEAARLLSRAFSRHPETPGLLRQHLNYRPEILAEYLGLCIGRRESMEEAINILRELTDKPAHAAIANAGPRLIIQFFGPQVKLLHVLRQIRSESPCRALQKSITDIFTTGFPKHA